MVLVKAVEGEEKAEGCSIGRVEPLGQYQSWGSTQLENDHGRQAGESNTGHREWFARPLVRCLISSGMG